MPNNNRSTVGQRIARSGRNFLTREARGVANGIPGTRNFQWQQLLDWAIPGNVYDSQDGHGWQFPGASVARGLFGESGNGEQPQGNVLERMFGIRPSGEGQSQQGQSPGFMDSLRTMFGIRSPSGYTPQPGMGIMPNDPNWQPSNPAPTGFVMPAIPGTEPPEELPQGQGPLRSHANPPPRGRRPDLDVFTLMREGPGDASWRAHLAALWAPRNRER